MDRKEAIEHGESVLISKKRFANYDWNVKRDKELVEQDLKAFETLLSTTKLVEDVVGKLKELIDSNEGLDRSKIKSDEFKDYLTGELSGLRKAFDLLTEAPSVKATEGQKRGAMSKELEKAIELVKRTIHPSTFAKKGQALRLVIEAAEELMKIDCICNKLLKPDTALAPKRFETDREKMEQALVDFGGYSIGYVKDLSLNALERRYKEVKKTKKGGEE